MRNGPFRLASAWAACAVVLGLWMSPVRAQEQAGAAPTPELTVEIRPEKTEWLEAETIRGVVVFRNTGATDVLMPTPSATPVATLRRVDGVPLEAFVPTVKITGQPGYFEPDMLAPGSTRSRLFHIDTEPLEPRYWAGWIAPPGEYELVFAGLDGLQGVRIVQSPTRITVKRGEIAVGERIVEWASDGWTFSARRENGLVEVIELATATRLWISRPSDPRRFSAAIDRYLLRRRGFVSSALSTSIWGDPPCPDIGLPRVSVGASRGTIDFRDSGSGERIWMRPVEPWGKGMADWFTRYSDRDDPGVETLVRRDARTGAMSQWRLGQVFTWSISPDNAYVVCGEPPSAGNRHAPKIMTAALLEGGVVGEWRTLFEWTHIDPPEGVSGQDVHHFAWLAGVDGVYRARVGGGVRFVSYDGGTSFDIESDLWFPIEESEDGRYIALASSFGQRTKLTEAAPMTVEVWDAAERRRVLRIEAPDMFDVRIAGLAERLVKVDVLGDDGPRWYADEVAVYSLVSGELEFVRNIKAGVGD